MLVHDCTRIVEIASFIEKETQGTTKSGFFLDNFFTTRTTRAEKLAFRKYQKTKSRPLLYTGACLPPNLIDRRSDSLSLDEITWPVIKAEGSITGCDVDERRIDVETGEVIPVGQQRYDEAFNWEMMGITEGLRERHILEAITLLKTGGYVLYSTEDGSENVGTLDFGRDPTLLNIDLTGTEAAWSNACSKPVKTFEAVIRQMKKCGSAGNVFDIIYSPYAWSWIEAHDEKRAMKFNRDPRLAGGLDVTPFLEYDDIEFKGTTNGGTYRHWVTYAKYQDNDGTELDILDAGEIMLISNTGFNGQRVFRTVTSDNREELPAGANFFLYDDIDKEYDRKKRKYAPWIEEYHLMIPANVNGAVVMQVVDPASGVACAECITCPTEPVAVVAN